MQQQVLPGHRDSSLVSIRLLWSKHAPSLMNVHSGAQISDSLSTQSIGLDKVRLPHNKFQKCIFSNFFTFE